MSRNTAAFGLRFFRMDECNYLHDEADWWLAAFEVYCWAQTVSGGSCRGMYHEPDGLSAVLVFDSIYERDLVAAEYEQALAWRDVE